MFKDIANREDIILECTLPSDQIEGAASIYEKQLFCYFAACLLHTSFYFNLYNPYPFHESPPKNTTSDYEKIFKFLNKVSDKRRPDLSINLQELLNGNLLNERKTIKLVNVPFAILSSLIRQSKIFTNVDYMTGFRRNFWNESAYESENLVEFNDRQQNTISLHLRNHSPGDIPFDRVKALPYQTFGVEFDEINNTKKFSEFYSFLLNQLAEQFNLINKKPCIVIFSQGEQKDFKYLLHLIDMKKVMNVQLLLNTYSPDVFSSLAKSEYLICAQSSFSYLAGIISRGKKFIKRGFRHPLPYDFTEIGEI